MMADVRRALEQRPQLRLTVVQDGAPELWSALAKALEVEPLVTAWREVLDSEAAEELSLHIGYFVRNRHRTAYASCRRENRPIGSGITEGACKSLIGVRAKRSGQRWSQRGLSSVLHLRAIHESDRFDRFWSFFAARYRARHVVALGQH
jgi:hypothetical protein